MGVKGKVFEAKLGAATDGETHIGTRLRKLRQLAGITQAELANRLQIDQTACPDLSNGMISAYRPFVATLRLWELN